MDYLEQCIDVINDYYEEEFGDDSYVDRNKLDNVGLLYTTYELDDGGEVDVQVTADLINCRITFEAYGDIDVYEEEQFNSLKDMYDWLYSYCDWDELYFQMGRRIPE